MIFPYLSSQEALPKIENGHPGWTRASVGEKKGADCRSLNLYAGVRDIGHFHFCISVCIVSNQCKVPLGASKKGRKITKKYEKVIK